MIYLSYCLIICIVCVFRVSSTAEGSGSNQDDVPYFKTQDRRNSELSPTTPPEIIYWASWKKNITVYDKNGMAWYCYTYRQSHCSPLSPLPRRPGTENRRKSQSRKGEVFLDGNYNEVNGTVINIQSKTDLKGGNYYPLFPEHETPGEGRHSTAAVDFGDITEVSGERVTTQTSLNFYYDPTTLAPIGLNTYSPDQNRGNQNQNTVYYPQTQSPLQKNTQFLEQYPVASTNTFTPGRPVPRGIPFPNSRRRNPLGDGYYYNNDGGNRNRSTVPTIWRIIKTVTKHRSTPAPASVFFVHEKQNTVTPSSTNSQAHSGINLSILGDKSSSSTTGVTLSPPNPTTHKAYPSSEFDEDRHPHDTSNTLIWSSNRDVDKESTFKMDTNNKKLNKDLNTHSDSNDMNKDILTTGSKIYSESRPLSPENEDTTESYDPFEWNQSTPDESIFGARLSPPTESYIATTTASPKYDENNLSILPPEKEVSIQSDNNNGNNNPNIDSDLPEDQGNSRGFDTGFTFNEQRDVQTNKEGDVDSQGTTPNSLFSQVTFKWRDGIDKDDSETVNHPKSPVFIPEENNKVDSTTSAGILDGANFSEEEGNSRNIESNGFNIPIFVNNRDDGKTKSSTERPDEKILLVDGISVNQGTTTVSYTFTEAKSTRGKDIDGRKGLIGKFDDSQDYENSGDSVRTDKPIRDDIDFGSISEEIFVKNTPTPTSKQNVEEIGFTKNILDPVSGTTFESNSKDETTSSEGEIETNFEERSNKKKSFDEILKVITSTTFAPLPFNYTTDNARNEKNTDTSSTNSLDSTQNEDGNKSFIFSATERTTTNVAIDVSTLPNVAIVSHGKSGEVDVSTLANNIEKGTESPLDFSKDTITLPSDPNIQVSSNVSSNANEFRDTTTDYPTTVTQKKENNNFLPIFSNVNFIPGKNGLSIDPNIKPFDTESTQILPSPSFTVGGDPCETPCMLDNERKTFTCRKRFRSQTPPLLNIGYCTPVSGVGHDGLPCKDTCKFASEEIWKCGLNQFCTPDHLIESASEFNKLSLLKTTQEPIDKIQFYPFNPIEEKEYEDTPFAQAYTVFGDPCQDACIQHSNEGTTSCTKLKSQERSPCTVNPGITHTGQICKGPCEKGTNTYFSCPTATGGKEGYCTPGFLILKANEWFFVNSIKDEDSTTIQILDTSKNESKIHSVNFFPFNTKEAEEYKSIPFAQSYTAFGDPCLDACMQGPNEKFTSCTVLGTNERKACSIHSGITHTSQPCKGPCVKDGNSYFSCPINGKDIGYCTPGFFILKANEWNFVNNFEVEEKVPHDKIETNGSEISVSPGFTVYGEPCINPCKYRGLNFASCTKKDPSPTGEWSQIGYCTEEPGITHTGEQCQQDCGKRGYEFYWCVKKNNKFGFCTPKHLINISKKWDGSIEYTTESEQNDNILPIYQTTTDSLWKFEETNLPTTTYNPNNYQPYPESTQQYDKIPSAMAYTAYGEPCQDLCSQMPNEESTMCTKMNSNERKPCTISSGITSNGQTCKGPCEKRGNDYFTCPTSEENGYCTPGFLVLRANEWAYANGLNDDTTSGTDSPVSWPRFSSVSFYPFNLDEAKEYENVPLAPAYTAFGDLCQDSCTKQDGESTTSCTKSDSNERRPCTISSGITHNGQTCEGPCEKKGNSFFTCETKERNGIGYCTPGFLVLKANEWDFADKNNKNDPESRESVSYYPFNLNEARSYDNIPSAMAYTAYGDPCQDLCSQMPNEESTMCTKMNSNERKPCTISSGITSNGQTCKGPCEKRGNDYFTCPTSEENGYCTPGFLVLRANEWAYANGLNDDTTSGTDSPVSWPRFSSVSFYPFNLDEAKEYENVPLAPAYTAFGDPCQNSCTKQDGESTTSCTKSDSNERRPCTISSGITHNGQTCEGPCEKKGNSFFTCETKERNGIGYCTPGFLVLKANEWDFADKNNKNDPESRESVSYYPFNLNEARSYDNIPSAMAYTAYGEPCQDLCSQMPNEESTMCTKMNSNERKPCTISSGITSNGQTCKGPCEKRGNDYFTCPTSEENGYCTPGFLVLRANEWAYANGLNDDTTSGTDSPVSWPRFSSVSFYPFNLDEAKEYENVPLAPAYTAFGDSCQNSCTKQDGESTTSCTKSDSNERRPCTISSGITHNGQTCEGLCEKKGNSFFTCETKERNGIGYCTPGFLVLKANEWDFADKNNKNDPESRESVSYYPFNLNEARSYDNIPSAMAYTAYGEPCQDLCSQMPNEESTMCTKMNSNERKPCTISSGITSNGQTCKGPCEKRGNDYFTCPTSEENGYCTPGFLVLRANEWAYANGLNDDTTSGTDSPVSWPRFSSVSFYPFNLDEAKEYENVPLAPAYTAFGDPCQNSCTKQDGESTTSCTKSDSNERRPCTISSGITHNGQTCEGPCEKKGNSFFTCETKERNGIGYCTPGFLVLKANEWDFADKNNKNDPESRESVSYYPFNLNEARSYDNIPSAMAYTAYGDPCQDLCSQMPNEESTMCTKMNSNERKPCTISSGITSNGQTCKGPCEKRGNDYFTCPTSEENGYCTPGFLVLRANEWAYANGLNDDTTSGTDSPVSWPRFSSVSFYPFNLDEAKEYENVPLAPAYTAFGDPCQDSCTKQDGESTTSCTKSDSNERRPCTISSGITHKGNSCQGACKKGNNAYFSCPSDQQNDKGYCTPTFLNLKSNEWKFSNVDKKLREITSTTTKKQSASTTVSSVITKISSNTFYPFNFDEAKEYENVPLAPAYTAFGDPCQDSCTKQDEKSTTSCTKSDSNERGPCTISSGITHNGQTCEGPCEKKGNSFFTCETKEQNGIGYCTPGFLVLKANEWDFADKNNKNDPESRGSVSYYPFNLNEARSYDNIPSAMAYTAYGEPCQDLCSQMPNEESTMCTKMNSNERKPCTISSGITSNGQTCKGPCEKRGNDYFTCPTSEENGYCTPGFLVLRANEWAYANGINNGVYYLLASSFTAFGEPCLNTCEYRGNNYASCSKRFPTSTGPWVDKGYCSSEVGLAYNGKKCKDDCAMRDNAFYSCSLEDSSNGYCTPMFLINRTKKNLFNHNKKPISGVKRVNVNDSSMFFQRKNETDLKDIIYAPAYTSYGDPCFNACKKYGNDDFTSCKILNSSLWKPCTSNSKVTHFGTLCKDSCEKREGSYYSCSTADPNDKGHCTPEFLISKTIEWKSINIVKDHEPSASPFDRNLENEDYPPTAPAYTVYGESCSDSCETRGFNYTWCTKEIPSQTGPFNLKGYCTKDLGVTHNGEKCAEKCEKRGYQFNWCQKSDTSFGFCTPERLIQRSKIWKEGVTYTTYGEECSNKCAKYGYSYNWCKKKKPSSIGTWRDSDYCSVKSDLTATNTKCIDECDKKGYDYYWCRDLKGSFGYCSPRVSFYPNGSVVLGPRPDINSLNERSSVRRQPRAYTVFGEACIDECKPHGGYSYTWCSKMKTSNIGTWSWADYCTNDASLTPYAEQCIDACEKRGYNFYWCHKSSLWGYCTPDHLLDRLSSSFSSR